MPIVTESIQGALVTQGFSVRSFGSGDEFLRHWRGDLGGCALLSADLAGNPGFEILRQLREAVGILPVILYSETAGVPTAVEAMKAGAFDFVVKPFTIECLSDKIRSALHHNGRMIEMQKTHLNVMSALSQLTQRERQVLDLLIEGRTSKHIATMLSISSFTVDNYRARILDKMRATTTGQLVQMVCTALAKVDGTPRPTI